MGKSRFYDIPASSIVIVKFLIVVLMACSQSFYINFGSIDGDPLQHWTGFTLWKHAFIMMFGVSGFLLSASWERRPHPGVYALARIVRLLPGLIIAAFVTFVVGAALTRLPLSDYFEPSRIFSYLTRTTVFLDGQQPLPGVFEPPATEPYVLKNIWTIKYLLVGAALIPVIGYLGLLRSRAVYPLMLAVLGAADAMIWLAPDTFAVHTALEHLVRFGLCFCIGMTLWRFRSCLPFTWASLLLAVAAVILGTWSLSGLPMPVYYVLDIYIALALMQRLPEIPFRLPDLSYGFYLYGWPTTMAWTVVRPGTSDAALIALTLATVIPVATLSWYVIERPALRARPALEERARRMFLRSSGEPARSGTEAG